MSVVPQLPVLEYFEDWKPQLNLRIFERIEISSEYSTHDFDSLFSLTKKIFPQHRKNLTLLSKTQRRQRQWLWTTMPLWFFKRQFLRFGKPKHVAERFKNYAMKYLRICRKVDSKIIIICMELNRELMKLKRPKQGETKEKPQVKEVDWIIGLTTVPGMMPNCVQTTFNI